MVATPVKHQLSTRDDEGGNGHWSTIQIATPAIVGGVLLIVFAAYIIWQRRPIRKRSHCNYQQVRKSDWATKMERIFIPRRKGRRVLHSSAPISLDDSMDSPGSILDIRRARPPRSDSSDSQTPLTSIGYALDYPPSGRTSESPPPIPKRRGLRFWCIFGSRPQEIKSEEPGSRWRVDGSDGSSTGHGHSSNGHDERNMRYVSALAAVHEDQEDDEHSVIRIGENFASVASTPMTQHFPEQVRAIRGMSPVPENPGSSGARTPSVTSILRSNPGTPVLRANRDLPPSYNVSQNHTMSHCASMEDITRPARTEPYMTIPPPVRTAGYSSPRMFHGRELSSESILATQPPMEATSLY